MKVDPADACGEVTSYTADDPSFALIAWFIEGEEHPVEEWQLPQLYRSGRISLDTRVWACGQPGWRRLDEVWELHRAIPNRAVPPDCCGHSALEFLPTLRGWLARRRARLQALRVRWFAPIVYRQFYRRGLAAYRDELSGPDASAERRAVFAQWWRRAGLPMSVLTDGVTEEAGAAVEASDRALRYPGWFRARLAGVATYDPAPWIKMWERLGGLVTGTTPAARGPGGMMILASTAPELLLTGKRSRAKSWFPPGRAKLA